MFYAKDAIGWIGNWAVIPEQDGVYLVDWRTSNHIFVPKERSEG